VFAFTNTTSSSGSGLNVAAPIVGMAATPDGGGYWLVAADGGIFSFGRATFHGSPAGSLTRQHGVALARTNDGGGYWITTTNGAVVADGDAPNFGQ